MIIDLLREKMRSCERKTAVLMSLLFVPALSSATPENDLLRGDLCFSRCAANSPGKEDSELVIRFPLRRCKIKGSETFRLSSFTFDLLARTKYASS